MYFSVHGGIEKGKYHILHQIHCGTSSHHLQRKKAFVFAFGEQMNTSMRGASECKLSEGIMQSNPASAQSNSLQNSITLNLNVKSRK